MIRHWLKRCLYFGAHSLLRAYTLVAQPKSYGARAIVLYKDEILLIRNIGVNYWSLPGGKLEKGETPESALERELGEELALKGIKLSYKLGTYLSKHDGRRDLVHIYVVAAPSFYHKRQWEIDEARWFTWEMIPENLSPATRRRLAEYKTGKRSLAGVW
jgi:ADP-ribose pyrophosphatase YjhB (NUDIX family)